MSDLRESHVYAYNRDGTRDTSKEIALHSDNRQPTGLWSDDDLLWVADSSDARLYAYRLSDGMRVDSREFALDSDNNKPSGLWSDGETMWVADTNDGNVYAYRLSDWTRESSRDFDAGSTAPNPLGLWSDGVTWWITEDIHTEEVSLSDPGVLAVDRDSGAEDSSKHFTTLSRASASPLGASGPTARPCGWWTP